MGHTTHIPRAQEPHVAGGYPTGHLRWSTLPSPRRFHGTALLSSLGICTIKTLRSLQPCRMFRKTRVSSQHAGEKRGVAGLLLGSLFQVLQRQPWSFSSQHIKQALAKGGAFLPQLPCRFQSDHPSDLIYYLHSPTFSENTFFQTSS